MKRKDAPSPSNGTSSTTSSPAGNQKPAIVPSQAGGQALAAMTTVTASQAPSVPSASQVLLTTQSGNALAKVPLAGKALPTMPSGNEALVMMPSGNQALGMIPSSSFSGTGTTALNTAIFASSIMTSVGEAVPVVGGPLKAVAGGIRKILESFDVSDS